MSDNERRELARAIALANEHRLFVLGYGTVRADGRPVWAVSSHSTPNLYHLVSLGDHGRLTCDCYRSQHGHVCSHRAVVHQELEAVKAATHGASKKPATTESEGILARNTKPFSIYATQ